VTPLSFAPLTDTAHRRRLLWAMPTGLYVLGSTTVARSSWNLMTQSLAVQAAVEPCVIAVAVEVGARTHAYVESSGVAALTVLRRDQRALVRKFVKPIDVGVAPSGAPYLVDAAGCLDLCVLERVTFASHTLFCCEVTGVAVADELLEGTASERRLDVLRVEDTKMSYGG
jgi:flavin reductase (DIM6/NTAB) family NADH-FMN oxidoreductase RutF